MTDSALDPRSITLPHDGTDSESMPVFAQEKRFLGVSVSTWPNILAPLGMGII